MYDVCRISVMITCASVLSVTPDLSARYQPLDVMRTPALTVVPVNLSDHLIAVTVQQAGLVSTVSRSVTNVCRSTPPVKTVSHYSPLHNNYRSCWSENRAVNNNMCINPSTLYQQDISQDLECNQISSRTRR